MPQRLMNIMESWQKRLRKGPVRLSRGYLLAAMPTQARFVILSVYGYQVEYYEDRVVINPRDAQHIPTCMPILLEA